MSLSKENAMITFLLHCLKKESLLKIKTYYYLEYVYLLLDYENMGSINDINYSMLKDIKKEKHKPIKLILILHNYLLNYLQFFDEEEYDWINTNKVNDLDSFKKLFTEGFLDDNDIKIINNLFAVFSERKELNKMTHQKYTELEGKIQKEMDEYFGMEVELQYDFYVRDHQKYFDDLATGRCTMKYYYIENGSLYKKESSADNAKGYPIFSINEFYDSALYYVKTCFEKTTIYNKLNSNHFLFCDKKHVFSIVLNFEGFL